MNKVAIVAIDGFDPFLVEKWEDELPNLKKLKNKGMVLPLKSTLPYDSVTAWSSIYTGLNPANHGLLHHIDYLSVMKSKEKLKVEIDTRDIADKTFWDVAGRFGKKVIIINPFLAYPAWKVNGIMASGPAFMGGDIQAYPEEIVQKYKMPKIGGLTSFPTRKMLKDFYEESFKETEQLAEFGIEILNNYKYDLFFICFLTLDRLQHFLWRYHDEDDPTYPGENRFKDIIKKAYIQMDKIIGDYNNGVDEETAFIVHSDHGHGMRCTHFFNLNELLRRNGFLTSKVSRLKFIDPKYLIEKTKTKFLTLMHRSNMEDYIYKIARAIPILKKLKKPSYIIDETHNLASASDFAGTNPFGGVVINKAEVRRRGLDYEKIRDEIISLIENVTNSNDEKIAKWAVRKEELYSGKFIDKYPDILFKLDERYGVNWSLYSSIVEESYTHKKISGGHKEDAFFLLCNFDKKIVKKKMTVMDIFPTILDLLEIKFEKKIDGATIFEYKI